MRFNFKKIGRVAFPILGAMVLSTWLMVRRHQFDPYSFLADRHPDEVLVRGPGSWGPKEWRIYSWEGDWNAVVQQVRKELPSYGLREEPIDSRFPRERVWMSEKINGGLCGVSSDTLVVVARGRALPRKGAYSFADDDPRWVTVGVETNLSDSWINVIRYTFFAFDD